MPRLAWFTPLPPVTSGIAKYSGELLPLLADAHQIDVFVDGKAAQFISPDPRVRLHDAHDFVWKNRREPYDLVVYQLGNAPCHDYMWAYVVRYPGLAVLHDGQLHHARARMLLRRKRYDDYRREFWFNHPDANVDLPELGVEGLLRSLTYLWPMLRAVVESSRLVAVHNRWLGEHITEQYPRARVQVVDMGVPEPAASDDARERIRARHGIPPGAVLFVAFGKVTPEKRIHQVIRAMAAIREDIPQVHLLLAGESVDHYDPRADARAQGIERHMTVTGFVDDEAIGDYLAAADVCVCMRWPSSRETSASWLRCIAAGRATITTDLIHTADVQAFDPRSWTVPQGRGDSPVAVSIDILDEDHSLGLAMRRLATDPTLRELLGANARRLWSERFRLAQMAARYQDVIADAIATPVPDSASRAHLPRHLLSDGTEHTEHLLRDAGLAGALRQDLWTGEPT